MKKYVCPVCGYVHEGDNPPEKCPQCGVPGEKFTVMQEGALNFACEHVIGVGAKGKIDDEVYQGLKDNFTGECTEVGMYIAMSRQAIREGYPEVGAFFLQAALEEAARLLLILQRKTCNFVLRLNAVQPQVNSSLLSVLKRLIMTLFTILFMKWRKMKQDTVKVLRVC